MKKILPLIASFAVILMTANAQNDSLERAIQLGYYTNYNYGIKEFQGQKFYIGFTASDSTGISERTYVTRLDEDGSTLWQREAFDSIYNTGAINKLLQTFDNNIVLAGYEQQCDTTIGSGYVQKVSRLTGNTIWLKSFNFTYGKSFGNDIVELPDSGFWVANKTMLYRLNSVGDSLTSRNYNLGRIFKLTVTSANYILIGCDFGVIKIDTAGNVIDTLALSNDVRHIACQSDSFYFFDSGKTIYKTDSALTVMDVDTTFDYCTSLNAMVISNNRLWVMLHLPTGECKLFKRDFNFVNWGQHLFSYLNGSDLDVRDMLVNLHSFELFIHERTSKLNNHLLLKNWVNAANSTYYYNTDVGITGFYAVSSYANIFYNGAQTIVTPYFDLMVNVKNYSPVPVNELFLNAVIDTNLNICLPHIYGQSFSGLNLQPGDSVNLHVGWIQAEAYDSSLNQNNERTLCFWTSSPDHRMDYNHTNDNICQTLIVNNFTGINQINVDEAITISPNPVSDQITLKSKINLSDASLKIIDVMGNSVIEKNQLANASFKISVNNLPPGIYFMIITSSSKSYVMKFLKM